MLLIEGAAEEKEEPSISIHTSHAVAVLEKAEKKWQNKTRRRRSNERKGELNGPEGINKSFTFTKEMKRQKQTLKRSKVDFSQCGICRYTISLCLSDNN